MRDSDSAHTAGRKYDCGNKTYIPGARFGFVFEEILHIDGSQCLDLILLNLSVIGYIGRHIRLRMLSRGFLIIFQQRCKRLTTATQFDTGTPEHAGYLLWPCMEINELALVHNIRWRFQTGIVDGPVNQCSQ